ncbi:hypothetical protein F5X68DRAFT_159139 [Plectosphaerella plurivora]|uniref:YMC020W-like alpha/beta hydrolase domain-containing protein n=1 Tax=Plectosphaerella plurivora TaxID=936078 RepID=A0A9P9A4K5_9PEZI|nr:hypothetical protein F5X68DRAFT_159139 [Plectosphaerella plurivora]
MSPRKRLRPNPADSSSSSLPIPGAAPGTTSPSPAPPVLDTTTRGYPGSAEIRTSKSLKKVHLTRLGTNTMVGQVHKTRSWYGSWPRAPKASASSPQLAREYILGGNSKPSTDSTPELRRFDLRKQASDARSTETADTEPLPSLPNIPETTQTLENLPEDNKTTPPGAVNPISSSAVPPSSAGLPEQSSGPAPQPTSPKAEAQPPATASSWFPFWGPAVQPELPSVAEETEQTPSAPNMPSDKEPEDTPMPDAPASAPEPPVTSPPPSVGSTWAFWSRDVNPKPAGKPQEETQSGPGELAVIGQGSEAHPEHAPGLDMSNSETATQGDAQPSKATPQEPKTKGGLVATIRGKKSKRLRPQSMDLDESPLPSGASTPQPDASSKASIAESVPDSPSKATPSKQAATPETPTKAGPPNLLLPSFGSTYRMKDNPTIIQQITKLLLRTRQSPANHVFRVKETPKIKKAIAIGVHGLFPASYLRPLIGQPTGTSLRFANLCAESIRRWADAHGCQDCEIEKVALEGEGKIASRVDNLWKLLLNWIEQLRSADLIILACHSQGVPVAVMLLAKLIDLGIITNARIGVCAMAGVSLGPFPDYKSSMGMLMGTGAELWEFSNPDSDISQRYEAALKEVLEYGARITFVGSIDDQLVPMESAVYSPATHPYIYRAVFIDGRIHAPDFIAHLVGFALKLRNLGVSDHGLIRELSSPLAGSLYSGEGHSRLYYEDQVYDLAVAHALETTDIPNLPRNRNRICEITHPHRPATSGSSTSAATQTTGTGSVRGAAVSTGALANPNPYHLPWIMRGLLEENFVKTELSSETEELLQQFDDWKPVTKALKDVKYRLEAVRSRL